MNPYEESELESEDMYCELCGRIMSVQEYIDSDGICDECYELIEDERRPNEKSR